MSVEISLPQKARSRIVVGEKPLTISEALGPGWYFLAMVSAHTPTLRGPGINAMPPLTGSSLNLSSTLQSVNLVAADETGAITALAGMAFLAAGHTPGRGRYGGNVQKAVDYVLARTKPNGFITEDDQRYHGPMYGHGFAAMFLAEVYGMSPRKDVREKLEAAIGLIVNTQNREGGWRYQPEARDADISVTVCQVMALRAARNAGIAVPKVTIDQASDYILACQNPDGGFKYQRGRAAESAFPRSAAAVVALYGAGVFEGRDLERGLDYLMRYLPQGDTFRFESHYFYGQYYAVQAMWHAGGNYWERWYPAIRDEMLRRQLPNGGWPDPTACPEYGTAMACLVLQMPNNFLPIFQR
jgi:hypothetical protein